MKRLASTLGLMGLSTAMLLGGCAGLHTLSTDVSSYGEWPAGRTPGSYAFERLPSQQARPAESDALEASARAALDKAGFKPAEPGKEPEVLVQVGAVDGRVAFVPWDDPLWWRGGFGYGRFGGYGPWGGPRWGLGMGVGFSARYDLTRYETQVALLIRDRASGKPLFESRASSDSLNRADPATLGALFQAALVDFPRLGPNPRRVDVPL
jgi:hypothetical protein